MAHVVPRCGHVDLGPGTPSGTMRHRSPCAKLPRYLVHAYMSTLTFYEQNYQEIGCVYSLVGRYAKDFRLEFRGVVGMV